MQEVQTTLPAGSVVRDRYSIQSLLGKGGFGAVYLVKDLRVKGNLYALKEVMEPGRKDLTRKDRNRFLFESDILKRLDHRALPRVYRVFEDDKQERAYILMDYIDGPNLEKLRQQQPEKRFSLSQVTALMVPVIDAISYLHNQQPPILHRDIKPANIIASTPDDAVLVDFDIAKEFDPDSTTTAVRRCSPGYGAPEQYAQGTNVRTDIYGVGATIYTLLTGLIPPDALYRMTMLGSKGEDPLIPIDKLVPGIPENVVESIHNAMALDSDERFSTIEHFWRAFDTHATSQEVPIPPEVASPDSSQESAASKRKTGSTTTVPTVKLAPPTQPRRRKGLPIAVALIALFVALASAAGLWSLFGSRNGALSITSKPGPRRTVSVPISPPVDPTMPPASTVISDRGISTPFPTRPPSNSSLPPQITETVPASIPTAVPTQKPTPTPRPSPIPTPIPTPIANPYPILAGIYNGTVVDTTPSPNIKTNMYLSSIKQNKGIISGAFTVDAPLVGSGPFTGTIGTNKYVQFTVSGYRGNAPLFFWGFVQANQSLQGQYCSLDSSGHCSANVGAGGYWSAFPGPPGS